jgi:hypothetical protein
MIVMERLPKRSRAPGSRLIEVTVITIMLVIVAIAPELFDRLGARVHTIHCSPDGRNTSGFFPSRYVRCSPDSEEGSRNREHWGAQNLSS